MNTLKMEKAMITIGMTMMEATGLILLICGILGLKPF